MIVDIELITIKKTFSHPQEKMEDGKTVEDCLRYLAATYLEEGFPDIDALKEDSMVFVNGSYGYYGKTLSDGDKLIITPQGRDG